ncbi:MAG: hypothetical protein K2G64_02365 [Muribaculaceae bacterium]|nr:hypothetical protein [Muribaculaceae bacterium]
MFKHNFMRFWLIAIIAAISLVTSRASAEDAKVIYLIDFNKSNFMPVVSNEPYLSKLTETQPGSNIFVGQHEFIASRSYFRFSSALQDAGNEVNWRINNICPLSDASELVQIGRSGIFTADNVHDAPILSAWEEPGSWAINNHGEYQVTVNLNDSSMSLVPVNDYLVSFNDATRPTATNYADFIAVSNLCDYRPAGSLDLYFYSPYRQAWLNVPYENFMAQYNLIYVTGSFDADNAVPLTISRWPGGILEDSYGNISLTLDSPMMPDDFNPEKLYLVGDFCGWIFDENYAFEPSPADPSKFNIVIPANTNFFKITDAPDWSANILGYGNTITKNANGDFVVALEALSSSDNITFDQPLTADINAVVDINALTLTLPSDAPLTVTGADNNLNPDNLYISFASDKVSLYADAPKSIAQRFSFLPKTGTDEWSGEIFIPDGEFMLNFYHELTPQGQPNLMLAPAPGKNINLVYSDGFAYATATPQSADKAGYWTTSNWKNGAVNITVKKQGDSYAVTFDKGADIGASQIYIIGSPTDWSIDDDTMPLQLTDKGGYYGHYRFPADDIYFRIYTSLGSWSTGSIGSDPGFENIELDLSDQEISMPCYKGGEGCWVLYGWDGSELYVYADLSSNKVTFSKSPIAAAGEIITEIIREPVKEGPFCSVDNGQLIKLKLISDGVYSFKPSFGIGGTHSFNFFTRSLPISPDEEAWKCSYTISFPGEATADLKADNYADFDIVINDQVGSSPATPLTVVTDESLPSCPEFVLDLNNNKAYVANMGQIIVVLKDEEMPNAMNIRNFKGRIIYSDGYDGVIADIPANKFDILLYIPGTDSEAEVENISFEDDGFALANNGSMYGWYGSRLISDNWHGGPAYISTSFAFDFAKISAINARTLNGSGNPVISQLKADAANPMLYKGTIDFRPVENNQYPVPHSLYFDIAEKKASINQGFGETERYFNLSLAAPVRRSNIGRMSNYDSRNLYFSDNKVQSGLGFNSIGFFASNISASAKVEAIVDLNNLTLEATIVEGTCLPIFQTASDNDAFNAVKSYRSSDNPSLYYLESHNIPATDGGYSFNLVTDKSTVIIPANGATTVIDFDNTGSWTGQYKEVAAADVRTAASQNAQWHFDVPANDATHINMTIDEKAGTITMHSMAHNTGYFIEKNYMFTRIDNLKEAKEQMLMPTDREGVLAGQFAIEEQSEDGFTWLTFTSQPYNSTFNYTGNYFGLSGDYNNNQVIDLTNDDSSTVNAWHNYNYNGNLNRYPAQAWQFVDNPGKYDVVYDSNANTLTVSRHTTGVDNTFDESATDNTVTIIPGQGFVTVIASEPTTVNFYNVGGMLMKSIKVNEGVATFDIANGFYIANGKKIVVK